MENCPANEAELLSQDEITAINRHAMSSYTEFPLAGQMILQFRQIMMETVNQTWQSSVHQTVFGISIEASLALSAFSLEPVEIFRFRQIMMEMDVLVFQFLEMVFGI